MPAKISVEIDVSSGAALFTLPDFGLAAKETLIDENIWYLYKDELVGGREVWGMIEPGYRPPDYDARPKISGKIRLLKFKNFCPYKIDLDFYKEARKNFSFDEWLQILPGAIDYNAAGNGRADEKLTMLTRLLPFVEKRLNLIELAPKGMGKSYVFGQVSRFGWLPTVFHESALIERVHGFIKSRNIPRMNDDMKICGRALNSEYFCAILHELREDVSYRAIVDKLTKPTRATPPRLNELPQRI